MPSLPREDAPIRQRYLAAKILVCLLYSGGDSDAGLERLQDGSVLLRTAVAARKLFGLNSSRLRDQLLWLRANGYLDLYDDRYKMGQVRVRPAPPLVTYAVST